MHNAGIQKQLIECRIRDLKSHAAAAYARHAVTVPRPRRWRLRSALTPSTVRFAI
jgi:hypothetical protein